MMPVEHGSTVPASALEELMTFRTSDHQKEISIKKIHLDNLIIWKKERIHAKPFLRDKRCSLPLWPWVWDMGLLPSSSACCDLSTKEGKAKWSFKILIFHQPFFFSQIRGNFQVGVIWRHFFIPIWLYHQRINLESLVIVGMIPQLHHHLMGEVHLTTSPSSDTTFSTRGYHLSGLLVYFRNCHMLQVVSICCSVAKNHVWLLTWQSKSLFGWMFIRHNGPKPCQFIWKSPWKQVVH